MPVAPVGPGSVVALLADSGHVSRVFRQRIRSRPPVDEGSVFRVDCHLVGQGEQVGLPDDVLR